MLLNNSIVQIPIAWEGPRENMTEISEKEVIVKSIQSIIPFQVKVGESIHTLLFPFTSTDSPYVMFLFLVF